MYGGLAQGSNSIEAIKLDDLPGFSNNLNNTQSFTDWLARQHADAPNNNWTIIGRQESIGSNHGDEIVCWTSKMWSPPQELQRLLDNELGDVEGNGQ